MKILTGTSLLVLSGLLSLALISGCGNSNTASATSVSTAENTFYSHGVVPDSNGVLWAAGYNGYGQLGDGTLANVQLFALVRSVFSTEPNNQLTAAGYSSGANHVLAFDNHSTVWAWGSNFSGRLGVGTLVVTPENLPTTGGRAFSAWPLPVPTISKIGHVSSVAAGWKHSLAVVNSKVYAWGDNTFGQVGFGFPLPEWDYPVEVPFSETMEEVAAGGSHSLARTSDGKIYAWGYNSYGQVGQSTVFINTIPAFFTIPIPVTLPPGRTAKHIAAAGSYSLAVLDDNKIYGWGYGLYGQLGRGAILWRSAGEGPGLFGELLPVQLNDGNDGPGADLVLPAGQYQKVAPGQLHVLALQRDPTDPTDKGRVFAWGDNEKGQLGIADATGLQAKVGFWVGYATEVTILNNLIANSTNGVTAVYAFGNTSYAQIDGHWYGWGDNNWGQLGRPVPFDTVSYILTPTSLSADWGRANF